MSLFGFLSRRGSAPVARDRLQILLAHERVSRGGDGPELMLVLQDEILAVIKKHVQIDRDKVQVKVDRGAAVSTLEIDIEMPSLPMLRAGHAGGRA